MELFVAGPGFRAARLGDGDYKADDTTWVQVRGTAVIVRRDACLVLARAADRGVDSSDKAGDTAVADAEARF